jgi:hypothetical protein
MFGMGHWNEVTSDKPPISQMRLTVIEINKIKTILFVWNKKNKILKQPEHQNKFTHR